MKKILLTGATGFIGKSVTQELLKRGYEVFAVSNSKSLPEQKGLVQVGLDLFDEKSVEKFLNENKFASLIHLAWYLGPKFGQSDMNLDWLSASLKLLKIFKQNGGKKVLFAGTMSEYDYSYGYLKEDLTPLNNSSLYGKCKAALFETASAYTKQEKIDFKWARIFNVYGPNEKPSRLMPSVICSILKNEEIKLSTCLKTQDYLHVYDVASGIVDLFKSEVQGGVNISSGIPVKLRDIVDKIAQIMNYKGEIQYGAIPTTFDEPFVVGSNEILTQKIGWKPKFTLEEGLTQTIKYWEDSILKEREYDKCNS